MLDGEPCIAGSCQPCSWQYASKQLACVRTLLRTCSSTPSSLRRCLVSVAICKQAQHPTADCTRNKARRRAALAHLVQPYMPTEIEICERGL